MTNNNFRIDKKVGGGVLVGDRSVEDCLGELYTHLVLVHKYSDINNPPIDPEDRAIDVEDTPDDPLAFVPKPQFDWKCQVIAEDKQD